MSTFIKFCGIDVSKDTLDYCCTNYNSPKDLKPDCTKINNDLSVIEQHFSAPEFDQTLFIVEYTGNYSSKLLHGLSGLNRPVSVVNPFQSKSFMSAMGVCNKNDKQAAYSLSLMGQQFKHRRLYKAPSEDMQKRKQIQTAVDALKKQQQALNNQLHAFDQLPIQSELGADALKKVLSTVKTELEALENQLYQPLEDEEFNEKMEYGMSVKGIGIKTAQALLMATSGLDDFDRGDKLARFLGLTPGSHFSGTSVRKRGKITKYGSTSVRALLYMGANSAIQYNKSCKELYQRLRANGKPHKVAKVAVMHKMVKQFFACVKTKTMFDNDFLEKNHD